MFVIRERIYAHPVYSPFMMADITSHAVVLIAS